MKILAIDTATEACSAAILFNSDIVQKYQLAPRRHAELILAMVDELLAGAGLRLNQLDALAFGRGPGAFTGVRIATGIIQGLAYASGLPTIPVSNLAALAQGACTSHDMILSAIDARMNEVYWCLYATGENGIVQPVCDESLSPPAQVSVPESTRCFGAGSGWKSYGDVLKSHLDGRITGINSEMYPQARDIITLASHDYESGRLLSADKIMPVYLRNRVTG